MAKKREPKPTAEELINLATEYFLHGRGGQMKSNVNY